MRIFYMTKSLTQRKMLFSFMVKPEHKMQRFVCVCVCVCVCVYIRMYFVGLTSGRNLCCLGDNGVRPLNLNSETDISL